MRKRSLLLIAGACMATMSMAVGSALADPSPAQPPFRPLQAVGSDTTQAIMNGYANGGVAGYGGIQSGGSLVLASWDATGGATITTRDPAVTPQCQNIPRPNGSGDGLNALAGLKTGFPQVCADVARSSTDDHANRTGQNLTYIPFALDAVTYATFTQSNVPKNLALSDLQTIFRRNTTDPGGCFFKPRVPQAGSGTRNFWNTLVGPFGTCVDTTNTIEEHNGAIIGTDPDVIAPYGVGPWVTQTTNPNVTDVHGGAILRAIDGKNPFVYQGFTGSRLLFNVVHTNPVTGVASLSDPNVQSAFVGTGSQVCSHPEVFQAFNVQPIGSQCGDTTIHTS